MFIGHYSVSFAAKRADPSIPLWALFIAVQLLDVIWAPFVLLGIEKVRIVPGITASSPLDLYYMPYTHSLPAAVLWSVGAAVLYWLLTRRRPAGNAPLWIALAVFSHWVLDFVVHRPDLPLFDNTAKVGLGLWNAPVIALALEVALLVAGMWIYLRNSVARRLPMAIFGFVMLAIHIYAFFGPPPNSDRAIALTALGSYLVLAAMVWRLERPQRADARSGEAGA